VQYAFGYYLLSILHIRVIKSMIMRWEGHVACMGDGKKDVILEILRDL
jgi:hypothetical protein